MNINKATLQRQLKDCMIKDQFILSKRLKSDNDLTSIAKQIKNSIEKVEFRKNNIPTIDFPADLPVTERKDDIQKLIQENQVIILSGETGSGKTTQIPKICLALGLGSKGLIGHTQPRRIAARTVANRIAEELKTNIGESVGYKVRFTDHVSDKTHVKIMTDGVLLAEIPSDRYLLKYEVIIIDEAHERSLNIDFILGYLKLILKRRSDLKVIITSATIDTDKFSKHFDNAPVIEVSGRTYPVRMLYRPIEEKEQDQPLQQAISSAVFELNKIQTGDTLVFLPGEREIRETAEYLRKHHPPHTEILPLFARLSVADQQKIFRSHRGNRVVLATNVAETSLTVPGIKYVIDSGVARISRYSIRSRMQRLPIEAISQAAANQRSGRCGRVSAGVCIRLYSEDDYNGRSTFTDPEILRVNLASVILQLMFLRIGEIADFPFIHRPERKHINDGAKLLLELGAVDDSNNITEIGKQLARLPIDPRLGRMLIEANTENCLEHVLVLVAFLSIQDPRERPFEAQQKSDEFHRRFTDKQSDFSSILNLWQYVDKSFHDLTQSKFRKLCKKEFLSYMRIREWKDIILQLKSSLADMKIKIQTVEPDDNAIHRALLSGLLSNIGFQSEKQEFLGTKQKKFHVFPGSGLQKKPPKWLMAAEIVETQRNYARNVAKIDPEWIAVQARHIVNLSYAEPHWQKKSGQVGAFEKISLYGLTIIPRRRVNYGPISPDESREIFIRHALVYGELSRLPEFLKKSLSIIQEIEALESKARRPDILISEEDIYQFYHNIIPTGIYSLALLNRWLKNADADLLGQLTLTKAQLINQKSTISEVSHPPVLNVGGFQLHLNYCFSPGQSDDGITVVVPLHFLNQLKSEWFEWLVPGLLQEKVVALIKSLPKGLRRNFVPVPDFALAFIQASQPGEKSLLEALCLYFKKTSGVAIEQNDFDQSRLLNHHFVNFELRDEQGRILSHGKALHDLQQQFAKQAKTAFVSSPVDELKQENITRWDFGDLQESETISSNMGSFNAIPVLVDKVDSVTLEYVSTHDEYRQQMPKGLLRLIKLNCTEKIRYLEKNISQQNKMQLVFSQLGNVKQFERMLLDAILIHVFLFDWKKIRTQQDFDKICELGQVKLITEANVICQSVLESLLLFQSCKKKLRRFTSPATLEASADINEQLSCLINTQFMKNTEIKWIIQIPRYLKAIEKRFEKIDGNLLVDRKNMLLVKVYWNKYKKLPENDAEVIQLRWMIEEYRVSLFAQNLKTLMPISAKRLDKQLSAC